MTTRRKQPAGPKKTDMIKAAELVAAVDALDRRTKQHSAPELSIPDEAAAYAREHGVETTPYEILEEVKLQRTRLRRRANAALVRVQPATPSERIWIRVLLAFAVGMAVGAVAMMKH